MGTLLQDHLRAIEKTLLAQSRIPANAGHPQHKGTPRENFLKTFLATHLSERVATGQGEIIDAGTQTNEPRHQNDIIIYRRNFPHITFDHTISAYLAESVVATIEVKSTLSKIEQILQQGTNVSWYFADTESDNLMLLFLLLTTVTTNIGETYLEPFAYLAQAQVQLNKLGVNTGT